MNMIEKVARALCEEVETSRAYPDCAAVQKATINADWDSYEPQAKAVIEAMRTPTDAMTEAVADIGIELEGNIPHRIAYEAYIKQALIA